MNQAFKKLFFYIIPVRKKYSFSFEGMNIFPNYIYHSETNFKKNYSDIKNEYLNLSSLEYQNIKFHHPNKDYSNNKYCLTAFLSQPTSLTHQEIRST